MPIYNHPREEVSSSTAQEELPRPSHEDKPVSAARLSEEPVWEKERPSWLLVLLRALSAWNT